MTIGYSGPGSSQAPIVPQEKEVYLRSALSQLSTTGRPQHHDTLIDGPRPPLGCNQLLDVGNVEVMFIPQGRFEEIELFYQADRAGPCLLYN
jgi:hypothetical protein